MARNQSDKTRLEVIFESHARILGELSVRMAALEGDLRRTPATATEAAKADTLNDKVGYAGEVIRKANQHRLVSEDRQVGFLSELRWSSDGCTLVTSVRDDLQAAMRIMARAMVRLPEGPHSMSARVKLSELGDAIVRAATLGE